MQVQALKKEIPVLRHLDGSFYLRYPALTSSPHLQPSPPALSSN